MIAVIADDFTGAAEIAGIGLRYNLQVEVCVNGIVPVPADLLVINTDSRSMVKEDAIKITADTVTAVLALKPEWIYKKIDSVLRGHVIPELEIQMERSHLRRALVIPANPSLGRTISEGKYFVHGRPVSDTGFATDPGFAITDASVLKMLTPGDTAIRLAEHKEALPAEGIVIGEAISPANIETWAGKADGTWVLAGAADFFMALLQRKHRYNPPPEALLQRPHLYVSGTAFEQSRAFINEVKKSKHCFAGLPEAMIRTGIVDENWLEEVSSMLQSQGRAIVAAGDGAGETVNLAAVSLREIMARGVQAILERNKIRDLFIEGGSTSAVVLNRLGIVTLSPSNEISPGVVRMRAGDLHVTVKPGSYALPKQIIGLYK